MSEMEHLNGYFKQLEQELALEEPRRSMLSAVIIDVATSGQPAGFSMNEKSILSKAAQAALDPPLLALLKRCSLLDIAIALVRNYKTNINLVAETVCRPSPSIQDVNAAAIDILKSQLELRGLLHQQVADSNQLWFENLCQKYPTALALQGLPWHQVEKYLQEVTPYGVNFSMGHYQLNETLSSGDEVAVRKIWSQRNSLRESIVRYGLPPSLAETLESEGLTEVEKLTTSKVESLTRSDMSNSDKSKIRQLWQHESLDGSAEQQNQMQQIRELKTNAKEAMRLTGELNSAVQKSDIALASTIGAQLTEVMSKLKVSDWKWNGEQLSKCKPSDLNKNLAVVQLALLQVLNELQVTNSNSYQRDEEVIERASAGLALYGFSFGSSPPSGSLGVKPSRPFLRQPEFCPLTSPAYGNLIVDESFSSVEAASNFISAVSSSGNSFAASLKISGYGFGVEGSHMKARKNTSGRQSTTRFQTNSAAHITYALLPVKSFRIPRNQMKLSVEAESEARAVTNSNQARNFLERFGSHVSDGIHHLGGIFWKIVEMRSTESAESSELEEALSSQRDSGFGASCDAFGFGASVSGKGGNFSTKGEADGSAKSQHICEITTKIQTSGPNVTNYGLFTEILTVNNHSWFIIDRAGSESLISVWEVLQTYESTELHQAAQLIRSAWLQRAEAFAHIAEIQREIRRVRFDEWVNVAVDDLKGLPKGPSVNSAEEAASAASHLLTSVCNADLSRLSERELTYRVAGVFKKIFEYDHRYGLDLLIANMRGPELPSFLLKLATWKDQAKLRSVFHLLNSTFDAATLERLDHADPPVVLPHELTTAMKKASSTNMGYGSFKDASQKWHPPRVDIHELVPLLEELIRSFQAERVPDMSVLNHRVARVLVVNLKENSSTIVDEMLVVVKRYGWTENGFLADISFEAMEVLFGELKEVLSPSCAAGVSSSCSIASDLGGGINDGEVLQNGAERMSFSRSFILQGHEGMPYAEWLVDQRSPDPAKEVHQYLMYLLKHRLEFPMRLGNIKPMNRGITKTSFSLRLSQKVQAPSTTRDHPEGSAPGQMVFPLHQVSHKLSTSMDIPARAEMFRLLLERRFLVPFITPVNSESFHCGSTALALVQTVIGENQEKGQVLDSLASNQSCFRVAIISDRKLGEQATQHWIKGLFHVNSLFCIDLENGFKDAACFSNAPVVELGWGFLDQNVPLMVLHVVGVYHRLEYFIKQFADVILADVGPYSLGHHSSTFFADKPLIEWASADPDMEDEEGGNWVMLRCSQATSIGKIRGFLLNDAKMAFEQAPLQHEGIENLNPSSRESLSSINFQIPHLIHTDVYGMKLLNVDSRISRVNVAGVRTEEFKLQQLFREEGLHRIALSREKLDYKRCMLQQQIRVIQKRREIERTRVEQNALLRWFEGVLRQPVASIRVVTIQQLEKALARSSNRALMQLRESERRARVFWRNSQMEVDARDWGRAVEKLNSSNLSVEHLWRELSHLYFTNPRRFSDFPILAAQHLIDGFSLELMDGDAAMMNVNWVVALLEALQETLQKRNDSSSGRRRCRLFVLSIVGAQSSGKSTLLNVMFGVRLKTSVSQTTRGVNIQLLPCHEWENYDFVLLMDTEGLRAPENIGLEDSVWRDNRMATFAILPADATIVLTLGESTIDINKVLPIVLSAYLDSELAQRTGGYLSPKLFFVFNQIDLSQAHKMETIVDKLLEQLKENASIVEQTRAGVTRSDVDPEGLLSRSACNASSSSLLSTRYFNDFQYDVTDEKKNDVRIFGRIKHGDFPPGDVPNADFGRCVLELREHIHRRVCRSGWEPRDFVQFGKYLELVWKCILTSNFQFDFEDALQRMNYDVMMGRFTDIVQSLSVDYGQKFDDVCRIVNKEKDEMEGKNLDNGFEERLAHHSTVLQISIQGSIHDQDCKIDVLFAEERFSKWRMQMEEIWNRQKEDQAMVWKRLLTEHITNIFMYATHVENYKEKMRTEIQVLFGNGEFKKYSEGEKDKIFEQMFQRLVEEAAQEHPPIATTVEKRVHEVFRMHQSVPFTSTVEQRDQLSGVWRTAFDLKTLITNALEICWFSCDRHSVDRKKQEVFVTKVIGIVRAKLLKVRKYSDDVVVDSLRVVAEELRKAEREGCTPVSPDIKRAVYDILLSFLVRELRSIQETWDKDNSTAVRFAACKADMRSYFDGLGAGMQARELLVRMLQDHFIRNTTKGFEEEMAMVVGLQLKQARWVENPQVMQAYIDMDLIHSLEQGDVSSVLWAIKHSTEHFEMISRKLIEERVSHIVHDKYERFKLILKQGLLTAATNASGAQSSRAKLFFASLKKELRDGLVSTSNCLADNLPVYDANYDCDGQPTCIFTTDIPNIPNTIAQCIDDHHGRHIESLVSSILEYMRTHAYGGDDGIRPRCGAACPMCGCACINAVGHEGDPAEKLHDTYHQPMGLCGVCVKYTHTLSWRSCPVAADDDRSICHSDGSATSFKQFTRAFPSWATPVTKRPLALREYIFKNYQEELVQMYPTRLVCPDIPTSYDHNLASIKREIEGIIDGSKYG